MRYILMAVNTVFMLFSFSGGRHEGMFPCQDSAFAQESQDYAEELNLSVGQIKTLPAANSTRVAVANPNIVDVQSVSVKEIVLAPKATGVTTLMVWDDYGEHSYQLKVVNEELVWSKQHADSLIKELHLPKVATKINYAEGKLLLTGEVNNASEKERLLTSLGSLQANILDMIIIQEEKTLVQIDAQILEINRDDVKTLGIDYQTSVTLTDDANKKMDHITEMFTTSMWTRGKLDVILNLLVKEGRARILSQPKLVCISGKEAEFLVGGEIPIPSLQTSTTGTTQNIVYKKYGISLNIGPTVKDASNIYLGLSSEITEVDSVNAIGTKGSFLYAPAFTKRNVQTGLYLKDNQSLVIAGLIKNKDSNTIKKFPFLGDVPILGMLWRSKDFQNNQTELVILLTPKILKDSLAPSDSIAAKRSLSEGAYEKENSKKNNALVEQDSNLNAYIEDIKHKIISSLDYSSLAYEAGSRGTVKVRLRILADGQLKDTFVISSSGSALLDNTVITAIKKLTPFPSFPSSVKRNEIVVDIPVVYS